MLSAEELKEAGNRLFNEKKYAEALALYDQAIEADPTFVPAHYNKFLCYQNLGKDDLLELLQTVLKLKADHKKALEQLFAIGMSEYERKNYQKAYDYLAFLKMHLDTHAMPRGSIVDKVELIKAIRNIEAQVDAKIFFQIVDLKFTEAGAVKILEMANGMTSGSTGFTQVHGELIIAPFIKTLRKYGMGGCFIAFPGMRYRDYTNLADSIATFPAPTSKDQRQLAAFSGVICSDEYRRETHSQPVLNLNDITELSLAINDKLTMHHACVHADITQYRPTTELFTVGEDVEDATRRILNKITTEVLTLKAPDHDRGEGVEFINRSELKAKLANMNLYGYAIVNNNNSSSNTILIESFESSKQITHEGKTFDPTARIYLLMIRDKGIWHYECLGGNWKLPPKAIGDEGSMRDKTLSSFTDAPRASAISSEDLASINAQLSTALKKFYNADHNVLIQRLVRTQSHYMTNRLANALGLDGWQEEALEVLDNLKATYLSHPRTSARYYHERGQIYLISKDYRAAITEFNSALKQKAPKVVSTRYLLAIAYLFAGDEANCRRQVAAIKITNQRNGGAGPYMHQLADIYRLLSKTIFFNFVWQADDHKLAPTEQPKISDDIFRAMMTISSDEDRIGNALLRETDAAPSTEGRLARLFGTPMASAGAASRNPMPDF